MGAKTKIKTKASKEAARFSDDGKEARTLRSPGENGNDFDIRMSEEPDGLLAASKIVQILKEKGVCVIQANAPAEIVMAANSEADELWEEGKFAPPLRVYDDRSKIEAMIWQETLADEERVCFIRNAKEDDSATEKQSKQGLRLLMNNMIDFGGGLGESIAKELGVKFDRYGHAILSCYTGDRQYRLHLDNPHACDPERPTIPDNGLRLSMAYYINTHWDPSTAEESAGGLDVFLTDPKEVPGSAAAAKSAGKHRIAPHADTLVLFLSERIAHQVIPTKTSDRWFCMTVWYIDGKAQADAPKKLVQMQKEQRRQDEGSDSDD